MKASSTMRRNNDGWGIRKMLKNMIGILKRFALVLAAVLVAADAGRVFASTVIYQDSFNTPGSNYGGSYTSSLLGTAPNTRAEDPGTGGLDYSMSVWTDAGGGFYFGQTGSGKALPGASNYLPFTPLAGAVYTLTATIDASSWTSGEWFTLAFTQKPNNWEPGNFVADLSDGYSDRGLVRGGQTKTLTVTLDTTAPGWANSQGLAYVGWITDVPDSGNIGQVKISNFSLASSITKVPAVPAGLAATPLPSEILLKWSSVSGATGYKVKRSTTSGSDYETVGTTSATNFMDSTVVKDTSYWYVVSATNSAGESAASAEINTQTSVIKADQTITFTLGTAITNALFDAPFADVATASSTLAVTYTSDNTDVATVAVDGTVTIVGIGEANILAEQAGDANFNPAQASQTLTVTKAMPVITWGIPASIKDGTALNATQLNATSGGVAGNFVYTPPSGTVLGVGADQTLSVQFTPDNTASYFTPAAKEVLITVLPLSTACDIIAFNFGALGIPVILGTNVTLYVPFGTSVTALAPTYAVSPFASGSPASGIVKDFTTPQTYTVTAEDRITTKSYAVSVALVPWTGTSSSSAYTVSSDDLLQTQLGSTTDALSINTAENNAYSHGTTATLTDGSFGDASANGGLCIGGGSVTYYLNTTANRYGYDISAIDTYSGWEDTGRTSQKYTVSFRKSGSGTFGDAITVRYTATDKLTHVSIAGIRIEGVDAVRFDFDTPVTTPQQQNSGVGYKELDVIGVPSTPKGTLIMIY